MNCQETTMAFWSMNNRPNHFAGEKYTINSSLYEKAKIERSKILSEQWIGVNAAFYGHKHSEETKRKISEKSKLLVGEKNGMFGKRRKDHPEWKPVNEKSIIA